MISEEKLVELEKQAMAEMETATPEEAYELGAKIAFLGGVRAAIGKGVKNIGKGLRERAGTHMRSVTDPSKLYGEYAKAFRGQGAMPKSLNVPSDMLHKAVFRPGTRRADWMAKQMENLSRKTRG